MPHRFDPTILREYDIRGIVGTTLFPADARALGRVFAQVLDRVRQARRVAVGYDGRLTSPELETALVEGLAEGGADVVRIGRGPTPMLYFAAATLPVEGGLMVTGSHNPPDHNGFKMVLRGKAFFGEAIQQLAQMAAALGAPDRPRGRVEQHSVFDDYVARLAQDYRGRARADGGLGLRQRRDRRGRREPRQASAGPPHAAQRSHRRARFRRITPTRRSRKISSSCSRRLPPNAAISASGSTATATASASSIRADAFCGATSCCWCWRATCCAATPARRSSPTSSRARSCSTRSPPLAASR